MSEGHDRLIRLEAAAEILGVPVITLRSARKRGTLVLPIVKIAPRVLTVRQSDLDAVIAGKATIIETRKALARRLVGGEGA